MNGYIIEPMWFYWVDVLAGLKEVFIIVACVAGVCGGMGILFYCADNYMDEEEKSKVIKWVKIWAVIISTLILLAILIPSKETMIQMQLAKFGTYENVEKAIEAIQDATDYILEHLK